MNVSRRRYMGAKGGSTPYQRIEYLECTGTQHIVTNFIPIQDDFRVVADISHSTTGAQTIFFVKGPSNYFNWVFSGTNGYVRFLGKQIQPYIAYGRALIELGPTVKVNNVSQGTMDTFSSTFVGNTNPLLIFTYINASGDFSSKFVGKLYSLKAYYGNTLALDLIPVRVGQVGYMYDRISGELFGNAGTGDFILGDDIVQVEYLESTGTQYIDTGISTSGNITIKTNLIDYFTQTNLGVWAFGVRYQSLYDMFGLFIDSADGKVVFAYNKTNNKYDTYSSYPATSTVEIGGGTVKIGDNQYTYTQQIPTL